MATYCTKCGGTGHTVNNNFCTCVDGKLLKAMASAREKTIQAEREAEKKEAEKKALMEKRAKEILKASEIDLEKMVEDNLKGCRFNMGDWVIVDGIVGTVVNIDGAAKQIKFNGHHYAKDGSPYKGSNGWVGFTKADPAPLEGFDDVSLPMFLTDLEQRLNIDYALRTGNKELFMELTDSD